MISVRTHPPPLANPTFSSPACFLLPRAGGIMHLLAQGLRVPVLPVGCVGWSPRACGGCLLREGPHTSVLVLAPAGLSFMAGLSRIMGLPGLGPTIHLGTVQCFLLSLIHI